MIEGQPHLNIPSTIPYHNIHKSNLKDSIIFETDVTGRHPSAHPRQGGNQAQEGPRGHLGLQVVYPSPHPESAPNESKLIEEPPKINKSNSENSLNNVNLADSVLPEGMADPEGA